MRRLITPSEQSVKWLMMDFQSQHRTLYRGAHVYFTEAYPGALFKRIAGSRAAKFIQTLSEINMAFIPIERQVSFCFVLIFGFCFDFTDLSKGKLFRL